MCPRTTPLNTPPQIADLCVEGLMGQLDATGSTAFLQPVGATLPGLKHIILEGSCMAVW